VIWTDVVQMSLYVLGAVASFFVILGQIPADGPRGGGGRRGPQVSIFDFRSRPPWIPLAPLYSGPDWPVVAFLTTASHGTDQLMVQRLLSRATRARAAPPLAGKLGVIFFHSRFSSDRRFASTCIMATRACRRRGSPIRITPEIHLEPFCRRAWPGLAIAAHPGRGHGQPEAPALNSLASTTMVEFFRARTGGMSRGPVWSDSARLARSPGASCCWESASRAPFAVGAGGGPAIASSLRACSWRFPAGRAHQQAARGRGPSRASAAGLVAIPLRPLPDAPSPLPGTCSSGTLVTFFAAALIASWFQRTAEE